jgi:hypothetical protein
MAAFFVVAALMLFAAAIGSWVCDKLDERGR